MCVWYERRERNDYEQNRKGDRMIERKNENMYVHLSIIHIYV